MNHAGSTLASSTRLPPWPSEARRAKEGAAEGIVGSARVGTRFLVLALLLGAAAPSQALFGDEEARKAIVDLREQVAQMQKDHDAKIDAVSQRIDKIDNLLQAIQRGQLEAGGQFEQLQQELAKLRGLVEQVTNDVATLQKRNKDLYSDLDARIKKLE